MYKFVNEIGDIFYYKDNTRHREDGPAIEYAHGIKYWFLNNICMEFDVWKTEVRKYYDTEEDYLLMLLKMD